MERARSSGFYTASPPVPGGCPPPKRERTTRPSSSIAFPWAKLRCMGLQNPRQKRGDCMRRLPLRPRFPPFSITPPYSCRSSCGSSHPPQRNGPLTACFPPKPNLRPSSRHFSHVRASCATIRSGQKRRRSAAQNRTRRKRRSDKRLPAQYFPYSPKSPLTNPLLSLPNRFPFGVFPPKIELSISRLRETLEGGARKGVKKAEGI